MQLQYTGIEETRVLSGNRVASPGRSPIRICSITRAIYLVKAKLFGKEKEIKCWEYEDFIAFFLLAIEIIEKLMFAINKNDEFLLQYLILSIYYKITVI